ncbi:MAG: HDOD domain-containing protein [Burkholderiales bacterium]
MAQSVLGSLTLGFRTLWNRARGLAGVQLFVHDDEAGTDGQHLMRTIGELWTAESPTMLLSIRSRPLLASALVCAKASNPFIEVPLSWLSDRALRAAARIAHERGARLIASGAPRQMPDAEAASWFKRRFIALSAADAVEALRCSFRTRQPGAALATFGRVHGSPVAPDTLVDGVASIALAEHALDQQGAWGVADWPAEDLLHRFRGQPLPPSRRAIVRVMNALDSEQSLERIEYLFGQEPTLALRLLLYLNSAGLGLANGIGSLRHGFMMLGFSKLNAWLAEQLPGATDDVNVRPINAQMVLRGELMEHLMDAGAEDDLRSEVYLCGLFAELELVQGEPLRTSLARIPLSDRIVAATVSGTGPYAPALKIARALERDDPAPLRALRASLEVPAEEINRALLRTLRRAAH